MHGLNAPESLANRRLTHVFEEDFNGFNQSGGSQELPLSASGWRIWDAVGTHLSAAGNDDLGIAGAFGTAGLTVQAGDIGDSNVTRRARREVILPQNYSAGEDLVVRLHAGMLTTVADTSATVDVEVRLVEEDGSVGDDLVETNAQTINSLDFADKDFVIDGEDLAPGSVLDVRITIAAVDAGDAGVMIPTISAAKIVYASTIESEWVSSGTVVIGDTPNGEVSLTTTAANNAEAYIHRANKTLAYQAGKGLYFESAVSFVDDNPNDGAVAVGLVDLPGSGLIQNGGLAVRSGDLTAAMFVKFKGVDYWSVITSVDDRQQITHLNDTDRNNLTLVKKAPTLGMQQLSIEFLPVHSGHEVVFRIDGETVAKHNSIRLADAEAMTAALFVKAGSADAQTLTADYLHFYQKR